ncbi:MAG: HU family DNA-binding protein [Holophagales bacterium]|nr:HU family DNA-binding protein [Holophagales bacterium]
MAGKADIIDHIANQVEGLTKKQAGDALEAVFVFISSELQDGGKVQIAGFGTFQLSERGERQGRNPRTGESITIPASKSVRFKPGKNLKDAVN